MKKIKFFIIFLLVAAFSFNANAQNAGDNDPTFNSTDVGFYVRNGAAGSVETTTIQPNGKIIIGGDFTFYNETPINRIARLNTNGSLDTSFDPGTGANAYITTTAIQPDGKIIIGGYFTSYNGTLINRIARLNTNGSLDTSFDPGTGANAYITTTAIQSDGKIIIGGTFTSYNGTLINRIARLNTDGSLDTSFVGTGANGYVYTTAIQNDEKIIIGGMFTSYNGTLINRIARLNTDGSLDTLFNTGTGVNGYVYTTTIQTDGKIIIGGWFNSYNGTPINIIARLNIDGTLDTSFNPGTGADNYIKTTAIQPDGKIIIGGDFMTYNGTPKSRIARLNTDGSLDTSFDPGTGVDGPLTPYILTIAIQSDGKVIIGGGFTYYNGTLMSGITRLNPDGSLDPSIIVVTGADKYIATTAIQPDGKIIIGGYFTTYNGALRNSIARLNTDGSIDTSFIIGTGANIIGTNWNCTVYTTAIQSDGKVIIGGNFFAYNGTPIKMVARLNTDGSLDTSFNMGTGANSYVYTASVQTDGKIIIGGDFTLYSGTPLNNIARLNTDGSLDTSFVGTGANSKVKTTAIQTDGKIIIGGYFTSYNGIAITGIARLNTDGSLDTSFVGTGANSSVETTAIQPDGKIIIGGSFSSYNGTPINRIARLNTDGSLDTLFNTGTGASSYVYTASVQTDGKVIIGGPFNTYNGISRSRIARLNTDGSLDTSFVVGTGANGFVYTTAIQPDGRIIIGGDFTSYNGTGRNRIARLFNNCYSSEIDTQITCYSLTWIDGITYTLSTNTPTFTIVNGAANGCDSVITLNLTINATSSIDSIVACDSTTWMDGNTYTTSTNTPTFILTNAAGCDSVVTLNLTINNVNSSYSSIDNGGGNYSFTNTSSGNFNQTHWAFGDGTTSTTTNPNHTFNANGTFVVVLTVNDSTFGNSCIDYYLDTIVVTGVVAPLQCVAGFVMYPDAGDIVLVNSSTGTNLTYLWDFGDGNTSNAQFPTHTYATTGNYYLCLTIDDGAGCVDMYCDSIGENGVVFNKQTGFTINVIAPPLVTQISEQVALTSGMNIYPNPTGNLLNVVLNEKEHYQLTIVTIDGKWLESKTIVGNTTVDVSKYASGMYFITATNNEGKVYQSKFVKE